MTTHSQPWLGCCSSEAVEYDQWQDINPYARNMVAQEVNRIRGGHSNRQLKNARSHTQGFYPGIAKTLYDDKAQLNSKNTLSTQKSQRVIQESIINGRFDGLLSESSRLRVSKLKPGSLNKYSPAWQMQQAYPQPINYNYPYMGR